MHQRLCILGPRPNGRVGAEGIALGFDYCTVHPVQGKYLGFV